MHAYQLSINTSMIARLLGTCILLLLCASILGQLSRYELGDASFYGLVPLFDVDGERNIPTFFTVLLALCNALLLAVIAAGSGREALRERPYWLALCAGFLLLAYDEGFQLHERLIDPMRGLLGRKELGYLYFGWVVPGILGVCVLGLCFMKFLVRLPSATRIPILAAAGLYLAGSIGMELIDGKYLETHGYTLAYSFLTTIEEGLEMAGLAALLCALLGHIASAGGKVEFSLTASAPVVAAQTAR